MWAALGVLALLATLLTPLTTASAQPTVPTAPTDVTGKGGDKSVTLSWTSGSDGGSSIIRWEYQQSIPASNLWVAIPGSGPGTTSHTVTGLTNGTAYTFLVRAVNAVGPGATGTSTAATPSTTPAAPTGLKGKGENSQVVLSWNAGDNGSSDITSYEYQQKTGSGDYTPWTMILGLTDATAAQQTHTVTGLTNGTSYQFKVRAVNVNGKGAAAESKSVLAAAAPGAPRNLNAEAGNTTATLSWVAGGNGGSPIVTWQIHQATGNTAVDLTSPGNDGDYGLTWVQIPGSDANTTSYTVTGLSNANEYVFVVRAINAYGKGTPAQTASVNPGMPPGKPTALTVGLSTTAPTSEVVLGWTPPLTGGSLNTGGSPITHYQYQQKAGSGDYGDWQNIPSTDPGDGNFASTTATDAQSYTIKNLTLGTTYTFRVRAVNATGPGSASDPSSQVNPSTAPAAPGNLTATQSYDAPKGKATITLSWTAGHDGGSPVTKWQYKVARSLTDLATSTTWVNICDNTAKAAPTCASTTSVTLPRAAVPPATASPDAAAAIAPGGQPYYFVIRADNGTATTARPGLQSGQAVVSIPQSVPSAPGGVYIQETAGGGTPSITLTWLASSTGGSDLTDYEYAMKTGSGSYGTYLSAGADNTNQQITNVKVGTTYQFRVRAKNANGSGAYAESAVITPGAPGTPGASNGALATAPSLTATAASTQVTLSLATDTGGTNAQTKWYYAIKVGDSDYGPWTFRNQGLQLNSTGFVLDGLTNGIKHQFKVRAVNSGSAAGPELELAKAAIPGTTPAAPVGLTAAGGDQKLTLTWTAGGDGGSAITGWQTCHVDGTNGCASTSDVGSDGWTAITGSNASTTEHTVGSTQSPLTNGTAYIYRVRAANAIGNGAPAQANSVTPGKVPTAPVRVQATAKDASVTITTTAPADDGDSDITSYEVRKMEAGGTFDAWETLSKTGNGDVTGLTNGVTYTFEVRAVNAYGPGPGKESASATPVGAPPPGTLMAEAGNAQAELTWTSGGSGGSDITGWEYRMKQADSGYGTWMDIEDSDATTTSHTVTDLANGIAYTFQVRAKNKLGSGDPFESGSVTPSTVPPQPASVLAERGNGEVDLSWSAGASGNAGEADYAAPTTGWAYRMKAGEGDYGDWMDIADSGAGTTSVNVGDLANGTAYVFQVRAMNVMGDGEATTSNAVTPATTPSAPTVSAARGDGSTTVSWTAGDDGGSAVTGWELQINGGVWTDLSAYGLGATPVPLPIPTDDGTAYTFGIRGVNDVGAGEAGTDSVEAGSTPAMPTVTATGGDGEITVSWTCWRRRRLDGDCLAPPHQDQHRRVRRLD